MSTYDNAIKPGIAPLMSPAPDLNIKTDSAIISKQQETAPEPPAVSAPAETAQATSNDDAQKYVLTFVARNTWIDAKGMLWAKSGKGIVNMTISKDEYDCRPDLQFMVDYGSITLTIV